MQSVNRICLFHQKVYNNINTKRTIHQAWLALEREIKNGRRSLDIVFIVSNHNIMSQKAYCVLSSSLQHRVMVKLHTVDNLIEQIRMIKPDLIICLYLTRTIPAEIYNDYITLIVHPGPVDDRGRHSVDRWILERPKEWGISYMKPIEK